MKTHKNQKGAIDLHVIMIAIVVVFAGSFTAFRIATSNNDQGSAVTTSETSEATAADTDSANQAEAEEVDINENGSSTDDSSDAPMEQTIEATPQEISQATGALFTKGGVGGVVGTTINVSATMNGSFSGTCTYTFSLGNTTVTDQSFITSANTCQKEVSVFDFPKTGNYTLAISFVSNDGQVTANIDGFTVTVFPESFAFTKGGGNWDGMNVVISETSAEGHTGTCNYVFTQGSQRVEATSSITNSRTCAITIPGSEFPTTGSWDYTLTFNGTTEYVVGTGGGFAIDIN